MQINPSALAKNPVMNPCSPYRPNAVFFPGFFSSTSLATLFLTLLLTSTLSTCCVYMLLAVLSSGQHTSPPSLSVLHRLTTILTAPIPKPSLRRTPDILLDSPLTPPFNSAKPKSPSFTQQNCFSFQVPYFHERKTISPTWRQKPGRHQGLLSLMYPNYAPTPLNFTC